MSMASSRRSPAWFCSVSPKTRSLPIMTAPPNRRPSLP
jgi:hypothetical protein